jgi:hypothetical protein
MEGNNAKSIEDTGPTIPLGYCDENTQKLVARFGST